MISYEIVILQRADFPNINFVPTSLQTLPSLNEVTEYGDRWKQLITGYFTIPIEGGDIRN